MPYFQTEYRDPASGNTYAAKIRARDRGEAEAFMVRRGLGERLVWGVVVGPDPPSQRPSYWLRKLAAASPKRPLSYWEVLECALEAMHAACYMGMLVDRCGMGGGSLFWDTGLVHETVHAMLDVDRKGSARRELLAMARRWAPMERELPGVF